jgi:hypothetical protein
MKRVVVISDKHCGHLSGLTPPAWHYPLGIGPDYVRQWAGVQRELWGWYQRTMAELQPIHVLIDNGDAIDGKGSRSGGTELVTSDMAQQADMAAWCMKEAKAEKTFCTFGTPYHVSADGEDMEAVAAREVGASIDGHVWIDVNGLIFDVKHKVGSSGVPHGRYTSMAKENVWNLFWKEIGGQPRAKVFIRSHVHSFNYCGNDTFLAVTTPALQGFGSKFGSRACSGVVDFGFLSFDVQDNGDFSWRSHLLTIKTARPLPVRV